MQDRADLNILVFSPDYLTSKPCQREMKRAIQRDPEFKDGVSHPREDGWNATFPPPSVGLIRCMWTCRTIRTPFPGTCSWPKCEADLGTPAPHWLKARDDIRRYLIRGESVNLTVQGRVKWRPLIEDLRRDPTLADLREVDLMDPETYARKALVEAILAACGIPGPVPDKPHDLVEFGHALRLRRNAAHLALTHFDHVAHGPITRSTCSRRCGMR